MSKENGKKKSGCGCLIAIVVVLLVVFTLIPSDSEPTSESKTAEAQTSAQTEVSPELTLNYSATCSDGEITIETESNCPDGTILQILLIDENLEENYTDEPVVKDGKTSSTFEIKAEDKKIYGGMVVLQFNAETIQQPDSAKAVYGEYGENMTGSNVVDATTKDGKEAKNASITFNIPYPDDSAFTDEMFQTAIDSSSGLITNIEQPMPESKEIVFVYVTNDWYLLSESEKEYIAETLDDSFTSMVSSLYNANHCTISIYDPSGDEVATSKIMGGMKIKK